MGGWGGALLQGHHQAVFADGKADARSLWPAERLRKAVVASTAKDSVLCAQRAMSEFKSGASVIVQASDQTVIHNEGHIDGGKNFLDFTEVRLRRFIEVITYSGKSFNNGLVFRNFAVEHPERIGFRAAPAIN